jgi:soluble lytic murein transglycosylase-like protein
VIRTIALIFLLAPAIAFGGEWPATPPRIGKMVMPMEYWIFTLGAARDYGVRPSVIAGVMAIESRYNPWATSGRGRCIGLMQLDRGVARSLGVNPWDPRENIRGGAKVLGRLLKKHQGNLRLAVIAYNGTGDQAYLREVLRAIRQAERQMP